MPAPSRASGIDWVMSANDGSSADSAAQPKPESPDRVDPYLSRKAQSRLDPRAIVFERTDGWWILVVPGTETLKLGDSFGRAKEALFALLAAEKARKRLGG